MMTETERIEYLINVLERGNGAENGRRTGSATTSINNMKTGRYGIKSKIDSIIKAYPAVNRRWLETGEGYPGDLTPDLVKAHYEVKIKRQESIIDHLMRRIDDLERMRETI